jgi:hypothetical protein
MVLLKTISVHACPIIPTGVDSTVVIGEGETYQAARLSLHTKLPQVGVFQKVTVDQLRVKNNDKYFEQVELTNSLKANFDWAVMYDCKKEGVYYSTASIPKRNINYMDPWLKKRIPKQLFDLTYLKKECGDKIITIVYNVGNGLVPLDSRLHVVKLKDVVHNYHPVYLICGTVTLRQHSNAFPPRIMPQVTISEGPFNFVYIGGSDSNEFSMFVNSDRSTVYAHEVMKNVVGE